jgi:hypothetical protein
VADVFRVDMGRFHSAGGAAAEDASPVVRLFFRVFDEHHGRHRMRVFYCPRLALLWSFLPGDGSAASQIHKAYLRALWRERGLPARLVLLLSFAVWPLLVPGATLWFTWLNGPTIARRTGKGVLRQAAEQLWLAAAHGILPPWYYMFELFDDALRARAGDYLLRDETKGGIYRLLKRSAVGLERGQLSNKRLFAARCREHGVAIPPELLASKGVLRSPDGSDPVLPRADLFVKPSRGRGGRGMQRWSFGGDRWTLEGSERACSEAELREQLEKSSLADDLLVQPHLVNHPAIVDLSNGVLATVRVVTCRDESDGYEPTHAILRMARGAQATVDNYHAGGIAASVAIETGELGEATDMGGNAATGWRETHPDTGARITGRTLPLWAETLALARHAHAAFPFCTVIGWDIAITPDGPVVIEGNSSPDVDIMQRPFRAPLGSSRFGELLAHHLEHSTLDPRSLRRGA